MVLWTNNTPSVKRGRIWFQPKSTEDFNSISISSNSSKDNTFGSSLPEFNINDSNTGNDDIFEMI